jgi:hypothetical protein
MIPIKIQCGCGQRYAFDVEPVNGFMPTAVACPTCGVDGTAAANELIAQTLVAPTEVAPIPIPKARPSKASARIAAPARIPPPTVSAAAPKAASEFNMGLGVLGAFLGACIGVGLMYFFYELAGVRFPLLGIGIGVLTGYGAKILFKGTDNTLGFISGTIALLAIVGTLYLMYGTFPMMSIISVIVGTSVAYNRASS